MKRYEKLKFAVLVIALILLLAVMDPGSSGGVEARPHTRRSMVCTSYDRNDRRKNSVRSSPSSSSSRRRRRGRRFRMFDAGRDEEDQETNSIHYNYNSRQDGSSASSFWIRNACHDGFVVVREKSRVLSQHEGLGKYNLEVKLVKESCLDLHQGSGLSDRRVMTRLYSPASGKYVCFNKRGKVKAMKPHKAERMGHLCAFYENTVPDPLLAGSGGRDDASVYINIQSAYDPDWYLGFGPNLRGADRAIVHTREGYRASLPRKMRVHHRGRRKSPNLARCDFQFATGRWTPEDPDSRLKSEWQGLFDHILNNNKKKKEKTEITKTADNASATTMATTISPYQNKTTSSSNVIVVKNEKESLPKLALKSPIKKKSLPLSRKYRYRKRPTSYLYLHNRKRIVPKTKQQKYSGLPSSSSSSFSSI